MSWLNTLAYYSKVEWVKKSLYHWSLLLTLLLTATLSIQINSGASTINTFMSVIYRAAKISYGV
jgi:hypothetical protein